MRHLPDSARWMGCTTALAVALAGAAFAGGAPARPVPQQLDWSHRFAAAALQEPRTSITERNDSRETAVLYAAEAARLARADDRQLGAALRALRTALARLSGTPLRTYEGFKGPAYEATAISSIALNHDVSLIACGTHWGLIHVWRVDQDGVASLVKLLVTAPLRSPQLVFADER